MYQYLVYLFNVLFTICFTVRVCHSTFLHLSSLFVSSRFAFLPYNSWSSDLSLQAPVAVSTPVCKYSCMQISCVCPALSHFFYLEDEWWTGLTLQYAVFIFRTCSSWGQTAFVTPTRFMFMYGVIKRTQTVIVLFMRLYSLMYISTI